MIRRLACPQCRGELKTDTHNVVCQKCKTICPVKKGIYIMWHPGLEKNAEKRKQIKKDLNFTKKYVAALTEENNQHLLVENKEFYERDVIKIAAAKMVDKKALETLKRIAGERLEGFSILNIGAGGGKEAMWLLEQGAKEITCLDISEDLLVLSKERLEGKTVSYVVANAETLPFRDKSFDLVVFHGTLHHVQNYEQALSEACRVARRVALAGEPSKMGIFEGIIKSVGWNTEYGGLETNRFSPSELKEKLEKNGFDVRLKTNFVWFPFSVFGSLGNSVLFTGGYFFILSVLDKIAGPFGHNLTVFAKEAG